jgi:dTMP kinase
MKKEKVFKTPSTGLFITFEGLDGSGKSLQSEALARRLLETGHPIATFRDPGATAISEAIRNILLDLKNQEMDSVTELLLYEAARSQMVAQRILPALNQGKVVVCDRFYDSTTAYQGYGRGLDLETIHQANQIGSQGLTPRRTYILDIPWEESLKRRKNLTPDRLESEAEHFYHRIRQGYHALAESEPNRIVVLDGCLRPEALEQTIWLDTLKLIDTK